MVQKSLSIEKHLRVFINRVAFRFHSDRVLFRFLIDRIFFRTFCDRAIFESLVLGSSSVSTVLDFLLDHQLYFSTMPLFFYLIVLLHFFIKNRCFVLHYILKENFALNKTGSKKKEEEILTS